MVFKKIFSSPIHSAVSSDDIDHADSGIHRLKRKVLKIMVLGEKSSGKSSIIKYQVESSGFTYQPPKSDQEVVEGQNCFIVVDGKDVTVRLVEAPEMNDLGLMVECIKDCDGFVLVVDVCNPQSSLHNLNRYKSLLIENLHMSQIPCIIVGNKVDLENDRKISKPLIMSLATKFFVDKSAEVAECSALTGKGVNELFAMLYTIIRQSQNEDRPAIKSKSKKGLLSSSSESEDPGEWL
ncbi:hypothetical protein FDP41_007819 [Naegleria fowleri]|uniref:Uncharacterized protein n=1 Tax=Naegleria fowleri TaxID=5763 RepID=A0A6A5CBF1_NAEFO|nr:uncharacterized protein FDP41_007819 [Naegleria fowleri]KAF0983904.1 hypothetical protein FDP41_007819 [Naegleria fowleri]CAG4709004.1 unnamed protein product [Naegleria fowleri]